MQFTRRIDNSIYSRKALAGTREAYSEYCIAHAIPISGGFVDITVSVKDGFEQESRKVILEFWNYFLDTACQQHINLE